jgi:hypothetical protein
LVTSTCFSVALKKNIFMKLSQRLILKSFTLSRYCANQSLLFLLNVACLAKKLQIPIYSLRFEPMGARTQNLPKSTSMLTITPPRRNSYIFNYIHRERAKTGWHSIWIMCENGATCLSADCCFSELAL